MMQRYSFRKILCKIEIKMQEIDNNIHTKKCSKKFKKLLTIYKIRYKIALTKNEQEFKNAICIFEHNQERNVI